jgi:NADH-quinone oxidoreductase subunit J
VTPLLAATTSERAELLVFVVLAPLAVVTAVGMVLSRNAVYSALLLVVNFFCLAGFYVLLEAQFVAAVQVIVYAGAIMVLFLFVLMLLGVENQEALTETIKGQRPGLSGSARAAGGGRRALAAGVTPSAGQPGHGQRGNVQAIGRILFTRYTFAFEIAGILLVVAAVGALVLGKRQP